MFDPIILVTFVTFRNWDVSLLDYQFESLYFLKIYFKN